MSVPPTNKKIERFKLISPDGGKITNESSTLTNSIIQNWAVRETSYEKLLDFKNVTKIFDEQLFLLEKALRFDD